MDGFFKGLENIHIYKKDQIHLIELSPVVQLEVVHTTSKRQFKEQTRIGLDSLHPGTLHKSSRCFVRVDEYEPKSKINPP